MKGARALASGMLVLAAICAVPAVSAAQDPGMPADTSTTTPADPLGTTTAPDAPAAGPSAGGLSPPSDGSGAREPAGGGSPGVPPAAPAAVAPRSAAHESASSSVTIVDFSFSPSSVTIHTGDAITWRNTGQAPHNATANDGSFKTPDLNNGQSASHTFNSAGTFSYICTIHPNMKGTIRVLSASGSGGGGGGSGGGASSSSSGTSESSAVASPGAAGSSTNLPMTGMAVGALALVGAALLASGLIARRAGDETRRRWSSPF